jgi:hypothetical protein
MTTTNWRLIRKLMNSALDACEALDALDIGEVEHDALLTKGDQPLCSVSDALHSTHAYPEALRYAIIRARGQLADAEPFVPPLARVLQQAGLACAELVGAQQLHAPVRGADPRKPDEDSTIAGMTVALANWYADHLTPLMTEAITHHRAAGAR